LFHGFAGEDGQACPMSRRVFRYQGANELADGCKGIVNHLGFELPFPRNCLRTPAQDRRGFILAIKRILLGVRNSRRKRSCLMEDWPGVLRNQTPV